MADHTSDYHFVTERTAVYEWYMSPLPWVCCVLTDNNGWIQVLGSPRFATKDEAIAWMKDPANQWRIVQ